MKVDLLILQLALIFLPGIIWARLDSSYAAKSKPSDVQFFVQVFLFGVTTYAVVFLAYTAFGRPFSVVDFGDASSNEVVTREVVIELAWALLASVLLSAAWLYAATYKLISKVLQIIRATRKYGDEDVWDFTFSSADVATEFINFRDFENKYVYSGYVTTFSETDKLRELVLREVIVYDFEGNQLFDLPMLYLARAPENIHIEFPYRNPAQGET